MVSAGVQNANRDNQLRCTTPRKTKFQRNSICSRYQSFLLLLPRKSKKVPSAPKHLPHFQAVNRITFTTKRLNNSGSFGKQKAAKKQAVEEGMQHACGTNACC